MKVDHPDEILQRGVTAKLEPGPHQQDDQPKRTGPLILTKADFLKDFVPPDYLVDGILQRRFVYSLTGQTGHGKSAIALVLQEVVASANEAATFGGHRVEKGRVLYCAGENADDIRMRIIAADALRLDHPADDRSVFVPSVFDIRQMMARLAAEAHKLGGVELVIVDTGAAFFPGDDEQSNTQMGAYARMLRTLTSLPGGPCIVVLCHPVKNVTDSSLLVPRGGGAFLNEMDGNLIVWLQDDVLVRLHWARKLRGPGFEPISFRLEKITTPKLVDAKGRPIPTVRAVAITEAEEARQTQTARRDEDMVLAALLKEPDYSIANIARHCGWFLEGKPVDGEQPVPVPYKSRVVRAIDRLLKETPKLITKSRDGYLLTEAGKEAARTFVLRAAR